MRRAEAEGAGGAEWGAAEDGEQREEREDGEDGKAAAEAATHRGRERESADESLSIVAHEMRRRGYRRNKGGYDG